MQARIMAVCCLAAGVLALTLHLVSAASTHSIHRAVSFELAEGNPLAWGLIISLCGVVGMLSQKLFAKGHIVRTILLLFLVPGLLAVGVTPPAGSLHLELFVLVCLLVWAWFGVMAFDNASMFLIVLSGSMIGVPVLFLMSPGLGERALIAYALASCSLVYYNHLDEDAPVPWKTPYEPDTNNMDRFDSPADADFIGFPQRHAPPTPAPLLWNEPDEHGCDSGAAL